MDCQTCTGAVKNQKKINYRQNQVLIYHLTLSLDVAPMFLIRNDLVADIFSAKRSFRNFSSLNSHRCCVWFVS